MQFFLYIKLKSFNNFQRKNNSNKIHQLLLFKIIKVTIKDKENKFTFSNKKATKKSKSIQI